MIKLFEAFKKIQDICNEYDITDYKINSDGSIDVNGNVNLESKSLTKLPLIFNRVSGDFRCDRNLLSTLEGCPNYIGGYFDCGENWLTSLEFSPKEVGTHFFCVENKLKSLIGAPMTINGNFSCYNNELTNLKGAPKNILINFHFKDNPLPKQLYDNEYHIKYILENQEDYSIWNKDGTFNELRFNIMMKDKDL